MKVTYKASILISRWRLQGTSIWLAGAVRRVPASQVGPRQRRSRAADTGGRQRQDEGQGGGRVLKQAVRATGRGVSASGHWGASRPEPGRSGMEGKTEAR